MLDINRITQLATEAAEESGSEITWKEAEARAMEPTKKILELLDLILLDLILPPIHQSPPSLQSLQSTERSKLDLTEYMRSKGEQLSSQLLSGIIDKFPEGLDILSEAASTAASTTSSQIAIDPSLESLEGEQSPSTDSILDLFRQAFTAVTGDSDFVDPVGLCLNSSTAIFLSYPPKSKKSTPNKGSPETLPTITDLDGWTARLLKKQNWARTYIADVWPVRMRIPYKDSKAESSPTYIRHTFGGANGKVGSKVRSIIGQAILFRYTVHTIVQRLVSGGATVNVFSGAYARRAFEAALDVVANDEVANDDGVSIHRATTPVYTVIYKRSTNLFIPHLSCVRVVTATAANAYRIDATLSLLRLVAMTSATSGNEVATSATTRMAIMDLSECRMAITGGLEMPEGQLEVARIDIVRVRARRSKTAAEKRIARHQAKAAAIIRSYQRDRIRRYDPELRPAYLARKAQYARAYRRRSAHARAYARAYYLKYRQRPDRIIAERERSRRRYAHKAHTSTPESRAKEAARKREGALKYYWKNKDKVLQKHAERRARIKGDDQAYQAALEQGRKRGRATYAKNADSINMKRKQARNDIKENDPERYAKSLEQSRKQQAKSQAKKAAAKQTLKMENRDEWERQQQGKRDYEKAAYRKRSPEQKQAASARKAAKMEALKESDFEEWDRQIKARAAQKRAACVKRQAAKGKTVRPPREA